MPPTVRRLAAPLGEALSRRFRTAVGRAPEGVWSAPGRVNLIGEHTDYNGGLCLPLALPHRTYAAVARRDDRLLRLRSAQTDPPWEGSLDEVGPGTPTGWPAYVAGVLWALEQRGIRLPGLDVCLDSQVPVGAGLSSSAALECAIAAALRDLVPAVGALPDREIIAACIEAENVVVGAATGGMDQTIAWHAQPGQLLRIDCRDGSQRPVPWRLTSLGWTLLVCDTRAPHALADGQYAARRRACERAAALLGAASLREVPIGRLDEALARLAGATDGEPGGGRGGELVRRTRHVVTEIERVRTACAALDADDVPALGAAMTASQESLRRDFEVSCPELDLVVETALAQGAAGARMTGGGFGGSALALVRTDHSDAVARGIRAAFAARGFTEPAFLLGEPSGPAGREA